MYMENLGLITGMCVILLVGIILIISLVRQVDKLEEDLARKAIEASYYSKETLDNLEKMSMLRLEIAQLREDKEKLQKMIVATPVPESKVSGQTSEETADKIFTEVSPKEPTKSKKNYRRKK